MVRSCSFHNADISSVGYDKGVGLPSGDTGKCTWLMFHPAGMFACNDAGTGTSGVYLRDDTAQGWHNIFRAPNANQRVRSMFWQDNPGTNPYLWIECNGELYYQIWPYRTLNPVEDTSVNYQHEAVIVGADIDMSAARLPKYIKEMTAITKNLTTGIEIYFEYQLDKDIGGTVWTQVDRFIVSPSHALEINEAPVYKIRPRFRLLTNDASVPPILYATVLEGFSRTPYKRRWRIRCSAGTFQVTDIGTIDKAPLKILRQLEAWAKTPEKLKMTSDWPPMDEIFVVMEPPTVYPEDIETATRSWDTTIEFVVREA
jgi:hypothetical protein